MEIFQDESTPEELIRLLDNGGYYRQLIVMGSQPIVVQHPSFTDSRDAR